VEVPEMGLNFWQIKFAIASGDFEALSDVNRRVIHVHLSKNYIEGLKSFSKVFSRAVRI
jgi:glucose-6-phosphate isomerase/transaldolase/glucose-6-phosphate isomerase